MRVTQLVTHSGGFHADELLSSVVLTRLHPDASLLRSRDAALIAPAPGRIVYDVGGGYDAGAMLFDHHQRPVPLRPDGAPYSSFGLIWHHFGADYLAALGVPDEDRDAVHGALDREIVLPVDLLDNGALDPSAAGPLAPLTLPALLEALKPPYDARGAEADDAAFAAALPVARALLEAAVRDRAAQRRAASTVRAAIEAAGSSTVLELPMGMPFREAVEAAGADHLLFVVHPREGDWALTTIRKGADTFDSRADLPAAWAGLTGAALEAASGVPGARFCHNGRFLAVASSREAVLEMAARAVAEARG